MSNRQAAWIWPAVMLLHALINFAHAAAHRKLGIAISGWQTAFIALVIGLGPIVAAVLLWTSHARPGAWVPGGSMAGALLFGAYFHFIAISPDHVGHLPAGDQQALFRWTALLPAVSELLGPAVSLWAIRRLRPTASPSGEQRRPL